jgi:hypothetical protein
MSKIQPGSGYGFTSGGFGFTLNTQNPFADDGPTSSFCPFDIYNLVYKDSNYYVNIYPGIINNLVVKSDDAVLLTNNPPPEIEVMNTAGPTTAGESFIYIRCGNTAPSGGAPGQFPSTSGEGYPMIKVRAAADRVDDNDYGYILIGRVARFEELVPGSDPPAYVWKNSITKLIGCNSLIAERFKCGSSVASYWWSAI